MMRPQPSVWESATRYGEKMYWRGVIRGVVWTIATLVMSMIMFLSSAKADGFYLTADVSVADRGEYKLPVVSGYFADRKCKDDTVSCPRDYVITWEQSDKNDSPLIKVAIGYDYKFSEWLTVKFIEASHESSVSTGRDKGFNKLTAGLRINFGGGR